MKKSISHFPAVFFFRFKNVLVGGFLVFGFSSIFSRSIGNELLIIIVLLINYYGFNKTAIYLSVMGCSVSDLCFYSFKFNLNYIDPSVYHFHRSIQISSLNYFLSLLSAYLNLNLNICNFLFNSSIANPPLYTFFFINNPVVALYENCLKTNRKILEKLLIRCLISLTV